MKTYLKCKRCHHEEEVLLHEIEHRVKTVLCEWCGVENHYEVINEISIISTKELTVSIGSEMLDCSIEDLQEQISNMLGERTREALDKLLTEQEDLIVNGTGEDVPYGIMPIVEEAPGEVDGIYDTGRRSTRSRSLPPTLSQVRRHIDNIPDPTEADYRQPDY
jgi:transcription elongation factor Elf1